MHAFVLQDWVTIRSAGSTTPIHQPEHEWLDLEPYQDVVFWLQVNEVSGTPSLTYQTSPTADDTMFQAMLATAISPAASSTPVVSQVLMLSAPTPLARFVRWQLSGAAAWDINFRVMVAANAPGL